MNRDLARSLIAEFLGPFVLVFAGVGAIIQTQGNEIVAIALAHGLAIGLLMLAAGHISGGHFNPAITIGFWAARRVETGQAIAYILAQCLGALAAAGALTLVYQDLDRNRVNMGTPAVGGALSDGASLGAGRALIMEIILTFILMFVFFGVAVDLRSGGRSIAGLAIGLTITLGIFAGDAVSGAAMNPARWFGPAVVQQDWSDLWVWWVGPIAGAVLAALVYSRVLMTGREDHTAPRTAVELPRGPEIDSVPAPKAPPPPQPRSRRSQRRRS